MYEDEEAELDYANSDLLTLQVLITFKILKSQIEGEEGRWQTGKILSSFPSTDT